MRCGFFLSVASNSIPFSQVAVTFDEAYQTNQKITLSYAFFHKIA